MVTWPDPAFANRAQLAAQLLAVLRESRAGLARYGDPDLLLSEAASIMFAPPAESGGGGGAGPCVQTIPRELACSGPLPPGRGRARLRGPLQVLSRPSHPTMPPAPAYAYEPLDPLEGDWLTRRHEPSGALYVMPGSDLTVAGYVIYDGDCAYDVLGAGYEDLAPGPYQGWPVPLGGYADGMNAGLWYAMILPSVIQRPPEYLAFLYDIPRAFPEIPGALAGPWRGEFGLATPAGVTVPVGALLGIRDVHAGLRWIRYPDGTYWYELQAEGTVLPVQPTRVEFAGIRTEATIRVWSRDPSDWGNVIQIQQYVLPPGGQLLPIPGGPGWHYSIGIDAGSAYVIEPLQMEFWLVP